MNVTILTIGSMLGAPSDPSDFLVALEADMEHDTTDRLSQPGVPTIVVGGSEDPFFPEPLRVCEGVGHGLVEEHKGRLETDVLGFLANN